MSNDRYVIDEQIAPRIAHDPEQLDSTWDMTVVSGDIVEDDESEYLRCTECFGEHGDLIGMQQ